MLFYSQLAATNRNELQRGGNKRVFPVLSGFMRFEAHLSAPYRTLLQRGGIFGQFWGDFWAIVRWRVNQQKHGNKRIYAHLIASKRIHAHWRGAFWAGGAGFVPYNLGMFLPAPFFAAAAAATRPQ